MLFHNPHIINRHLLSACPLSCHLLMGLLKMNCLSLLSSEVFVHTHFKNSCKFQASVKLVRLLAPFLYYQYHFQLNHLQVTNLIFLLIF